MPPPPTLSLRPRPSTPNLNANSEPSTPATPHGFRAQINHLIPRHSYFSARVTVHQIDSVPFVSGQFAVRWKFKHVHSPPSNARSAGLLGIVKTRSKNGDKRTQPTAVNPADDASLDTTSTISSSSSSDPSLPSVIISNDSGSASTTRQPSISGSTVPAPYSKPESNPPFSSNGADRNASSSTLHIHPSLPSYDTSTSLTTTSTTPTTTTDTTTTTPARGTTLYNPLQDHSAHWNQHLTTVVRLDVDRDNGYIFPCPFKLVVMQRPSEGDYICSSGHTNVPEVHRLGAVYLNLSEYVGHGPVERRYLLRESRTNATLKLTIELEFISGQSSYIPPPLPKGEILNGLSGYLESEFSRSGLPPKNGSRSSSTRSSGAHRRDAQNLPHHHHHYHPPLNNIELYGPYLNQEELELDLFGTRCPKRKKSKSSFVMVFNRSRSKLGLTSTAADDDDRGRGEGDESEGESDYESMDDQFTHHPNDPTTITIVPPTATLSPPSPSTSSPDTTRTPTPTFPNPPTRKPTFFDVERLPMAYGTKTTETLIEAIFNPVKTGEERCESPFTIYVPPSLPTPPPALSTPRVSLGVDREEEMYTPRPSQLSQPPPSTTTRSHSSHPSHQIKRKPVPNIEVASVYSTSSTTTTSSSSNSSASTSTSSSSGSASGRSLGATPRSVQVPQVSSQMSASGGNGSSGGGGGKGSSQSLTAMGAVGASAGAGGASAGVGGGAGGGGGGKVKDWWKKTVGGRGGSRPGTPLGAL